MSDASIAGRRILIVEDEAPVADGLRLYLEELGAIVLGPAATVPAALALIAAAESLDAAVVDVELRGLRADPVADALAARGVRFVFVTGFGPESIAERFAAVPQRSKPFDLEELVRLLDG